MARRRLSRKLTRPKSHDCDSPDRLPYPCYYLCADCGWLEDGRHGDPMRHDEARLEPGACPSCRATAWVDLGSQAVALGYREAEATTEDLADERAWGRSVGLGALLGGLATAALGLWMPQAIDATSLLTAAGVGVGTLGALMTRMVARHARSGRARPRRWRRPLPRPHAESRVEGIAHGVIEGEQSRLTPLTREPCLGWAVRVWSDEGLLLDEQSHAAFTLEGSEASPLAFEAERVTLDLDPRGILRPAATDDAFVRFMRRRGLSPHDASLRVYEAHLQPGVPVALAWHRSPAGSGPVLSQAPREL